MKPIRWGIIGAGTIAHTFCNDGKLVNQALITAIASRSLQSAEQFAAEHQLEKAYGNYQALFDDPDIDAIYIATPHNKHFEQCVAALNANKHVLCEKPITVSAEQCIALTKLAHERQRFLMEGMWTYFLPAIQKAHQWFKQGRIGELVHIKADFGYPIEYAPDKRAYNAELNGGCLLDMGIYPLALAQLFMQQAPQQFAVQGQYAPNGVEDDVTILASYPQVTASLTTSFRAKLPNGGFIIGTQGYIAIADFFRAKECALYELDEQVDHFIAEREGFGFEYQIEAACKHIRQGDLQAPLMSLATSLALQQQMEAILKKLNSQTALP
jgi:predicted dehydrogenase